MVKRNDPSAVSTDKGSVTDQAERLKAKDAPLGQLQDAPLVTVIGWVVSDTTQSLVTNDAESELPAGRMQASTDNVIPPLQAPLAAPVKADDAGNTPGALAGPATPTATQHVDTMPGASGWLGYNAADSEGADVARTVLPSIPERDGGLTDDPVVSHVHAISVHGETQVAAGESARQLSALAVTGDTEGHLREDAQQFVSGKLNSTGASGKEHWQIDHSTGLYGHLQISEDGHWNYTLDNASSSVQGLCAGEKVQEHFIAAVTDAAGRTQFVPLTIAIDGTADQAIISGSDAGQVTEDRNPVVSGTLNVTDADKDQAHFNSAVLSGRLGALTLDTAGHWFYQLDNGKVAVQSLGAGKTATDVLTVTSIDGTTHQITITVHGTNDQALISGTHSATVTEDSLLSAQGTLLISDVDQGESGFAQQVLMGTFGQLQLNAQGQWSYLLDNANPALQALGEGEAATDTFTIISLDGTSRQIEILVQGRNDEAQFTGDMQGSVTEDTALVAKGSLLVSDTDQHQAHFNPTVFNGQYGSFSIDANGHWLYVLDSSSLAVQGLSSGELVTDVITVTSVDGSTCQVHLSINGTNDVPELSAQTQTVQEDGALLTGQLQAHDIDHQDKLSFSTSTTPAGFTLNGDGSYSFDPSSAAYQHLPTGQSLDVVIPITVTDSAGASSTQNLTITVTGANDGATIAGVSSGSTTEDNTQAVTGQLSIADVDDGEAHFVALSGAAGNFGSFSLAEGGQWSYQLDNSKPAVQALKMGDSVTDTFTVTCADGTTLQVTVSVTGKDDGAVIGGVDTAAVSEDVNVAASQLQATGQLTITDPDAGQDHFTAKTDLVSGLGIGHFSIDATGYWAYAADNTQPAIQQLKAGESLTDTLTVVSVDGTSHTITVTIQGTNDAPLLQAQTQAVSEDGALLQGQMVAADVDAGDTQAFSVAQPVDGFTLNTDGSYQFDPAHVSYQQLAAGQTLDVVIPVTATDSAGATSTQNLTITVTGVNDGAVIGGVNVATVTEDLGVKTGHLQASGQLAISDADTGEAHFTAQTDVAGSAGYGHFSVDSAGYWTYSADNTQTAIQQLKAGESLTDTLSVASADGTTHTLTVNIQGTNDAPVLVAQTQAVTEDGTQLSGQMVATDADAGDTKTFSLVHAVDGVTLNTDGSYTFDPSHASYQHLAAGQTQDVVIPITVTDSGGATNTQNLTLTVTGTNDGAMIAGVDTGSVSEDGVLQASGQLSINDADAGEAAFQASPRAPGQHGVFSLAADGSWTYALNNSDTDVQALTKGQSLSDSLVVKSVDGSTHTITVSIQGRDDGAVIAGVDTGRVTEDQNVNADQLQASGQLTLTDADTSQHQFTAQSQVAGHYGSFSIDASGAWTYTADNNQDAVQQLGRNDSLSERFRVTSADGTQHMVVVTLQGSNDVPVVLAQTRSVTEDGAMLTGQMRASDTDIHDRLQFSTTAQVAGFTLAADGSYSFDPRASAYQNLGSGAAETLRIPVTVRDQFGAQHTRDLLITVTGTNDGAIIQGKDTGDVVEDQNPVNGLLRTQGQLAVRDPDAAQSSFVAQTDVAGRYGHFSIDAAGAWTYQADNASNRVQELREGAQAVDHFVVRSLDGSTHSIRITVHGTNDVPVVTAAAQSVTEDGALLFGQLRVSDRDRGDQQLFQLDHPVAGFTLSDDGSYRFDPKDPAHQDLREGQVMRLEVPITVTDSAGAVVHQTLSITLTGRNDTAVISGVDSAVVTEDAALQNGLLQASGQLQVSDIDDGEANFTVQGAVAGSHGLGHFSINASGHWLYTADNTQTAIQQLKTGDSLVDSITVTSTDGTAHTVTVTIQGANDAPVLQAQTQAVTEDGTQLSGHMVATDVDAGDTQTFSLAKAVDGFTLNANGSYSFDPSHASYQHLAAGQTQDVIIPITVTDSAGATATQNLTIRLTGTNDAARISGTDVGRVVEDQTLSVSGQLAISDADDGQARFVAQTATAGSYGSLTIGADGQWQYQLDNSKPEVQALKSTETATDSFTVHSADGSSHNITVTIQGQRDSVVIGGVDVGVVKEDVSLVTGGHLVATGESAEFVPLQQHTTLGEFSMDAAGAWTFTLDNSRAGAQALKDGETATDSVTITHTDGTTHTVTLTVMGTNDAPVLSAQTQAIIEDGTQLTGHMAASDVDAGDTKTFSSTQSVDGFTLNADGSYSFDPSHASYQHLAAGQTQDVVIAITVTDHAGATSTQNLTITVTGSNDGAVISGTDTGTVIEDQQVSATHILSCGGKLGVTDVDAGEATFAVQHGTGANGYGSYVLGPSGIWTYSADNTQAAIQQLKAGETLTDTFTVSSTDGTTYTVTVTLQGTNDAPVLAAQTQAVTEDGAQLSGHMVATDADAGDTQTFSLANAVDGFMLNADGSYQFDPSHASYQHLTAGQTQDVVIAITVTDSAGAISPQNLTITVTGSADGAVISGVDVGTVTEDTAVITGNLQASGQLTVSDVDTGEAHFTAQTDIAGSSGFGHFSVDTAGAWTYTADNTQTAIQQLKSGESLTDTLSVASADGTTHTITVTVQGTNDAPVLAAQTQAVIEDGTLLSGHMAATDADAGDTQTFSLANAVDGFTLNADGSYSFDPSHASYQHLAAGQTQDVVIPITVTDSTGLSSTQNLSITVTGSNDGPLVTHGTAATAADLGAINEDAPRVFTEAELLQAVGATDVDDGSSLHIVAGSLTSLHGTFSGDAAHGFTFTPAANFSGQDVDLQFNVTDGTVSREAHGQLDVMPVADAPDRVAGKPLDSNFEDAAGSAGWQTSAGGSLPLSGGSPTGGQALALTVGGANHLHQDFDTFAGQRLHLSFDEAGTRGGRFPFEVLWDGKVVATLSPNSAYWTATHHEFDLVATGSNARLEFRSVDGIRGFDGHTDLFDNIKLTFLDASSDREALTNHDLQLQLGREFRLTDTDGSETLSYLVKGLPVGFTLTDGTHSVTVGSAGQVLETAGWNQGALAVKAPTDFVGTLEIQVSARSEETANQQTATSADIPLRLSFEHLSTPEDTPQTFSEAKLLALADLHAPAGQSYTLSDVQVDPAFGHFTHEANGSWTFTPAANVNADAVPFTLTVSGGAQPISSTLELAITPVNDAPVLAAQTQAVTEDAALFSGHVLATDPDAGDTQAFSTTATVDGFTLNADGSYQFDPTHASYQHLAAGQTQDIVIPVTVTDHAGATSTHNLTITITGANDGPQVVHATAATAADLGAINEDAPRVFTEAELLQAVGATDADDGSSLHIVAGSLTSAHGTFTGDAAHGFTFTPAANFSGQDVDLQFSVTDGTVVREAHAQLDVTPVADVPVVDLDGVHSGPFKLGWEETPKYTQDIATYAGQTLVLDLAMTNVNQSEYTLGDLEVVWNGQVIATIDRSQHGQAFSYTVTASGESSQLELRAAHPLPEDYHAMWIGLEWIEKVGVTPVHAVAAGHDLSLSSLSPLHNAHLADTDGSETLSYLVKGLPVGFTLTDGTHSVTVGSAGQVIETAGWNQDALAVKAPTDFVGTLEIQVSARSEEAANQQTATLADMPLRLSFEHLSTPEDTPKTFTESQLLQLAGIHAPAGQAYMLSDVQVDPAFGHFTHDASGSWTFTPAANVNADAVPFTLTVSGGAQPITSQLQLAIMPVNDAPLVAHGTAAAAADVGAMTGGTVRVFTEAELLQAVGASDVDDASSLHIVAGSLTSPHGTFTGDTAQGFTFTPAANYSGQDVDLQFRVTDGTASTEAHAQVDVTAVLHAPTVLGLSAVHTDFDSQAVASAGYENVDPARWGWKTDLASGVELGADRLYGAAGSSGNQIVELIADPSQPGNLFRDIATAPGEPLRFAFDLSARPGRPGAAVEVLWEGKVIDTITPGSAGFDLSRHSYDLVATGSQARLELRTQAEDPQHMVLVDNLDLASQRATSINHDLQLNLASNFRLSDTNLPGETLSLLVKGLPVGFVLTDGVHTAAVTSAGQVIDTQGWAVADLAVRAPIDYSGNLQIQVSARADDAASHQSAVSAEHLLDLSFERITVAEDTPQTFSAARLLALAGLSAPVGKTYAVDDVQIDPAFGHFTHEANGSWTFTPAANVSDDLIPFKLTVTSGSGLSVHGTLYMTITPVNDAPVLAAQHQAVDAGSSAISGRMLATDEDTGDTQAFSVAHAVDGFTLHADGSYSFDPSHASYQQIAGGQKQDVVIPITVTDHDGATSTQNLTISVTGVGHAAAIGGDVLGNVTEDVNVQGGMISTSGQLTIHDADAGQDHFIAQNNVQGNSGLGRFSVDASGHWTYSLRNDLPDVDKLGKDQMMSDRLTVRSVDGTERDITVLIHGHDDTAAFVAQGPTVSGDAYTEIAQALQSRFAVSGFQYLADMMLHQRDPAPFQTAVIAIKHAGVALLGPDGSVSHTYAAVRDVAKVPVADLLAWHAKGAGYQVVLIDATAAQVEVYAHNQGNPGMLMGRYPYTDMVLHPDLNAVSFTPQMHAAASGGAAEQGGGFVPAMEPVIAPLPFDSGHVLEDNGQLISGFIEVKDPDAGQSSMQPMTDHHTVDGTFSIDVNGDWVYQLDSSRPDVQALKDGETLIDTITVHSADGTPHEVNITIHGQNDGAVITGADTGSLAEDAAQNVASGNLSIVDPDAGEAHFIAQANVSAQHGHFSLQDNGAWTYTLDNNDASVQALKAGESFTEHLTVSSVDGTTHVLTVTVQGSNDSPALQAQSQSVTEDGSLLRGQMVAQDGDHGDALRFTTHAAVGGFTLNADGGYSFDPSHHDYQGLTSGQVRDIDIPIVVTDSAGASSIQMLSLHISGKDDRAFIYGVDSGRVQAGVQPQTSGDLHASDDDAGQSGFQAGTVKGSFGSLSIDAQGHWTYQVDGRDGIVQILRENSHVNDQVTVHSVDGTAHDVDVEVGGAPAGMLLPPVTQLPVSAGGHDVFAGILAAVHAAGYQYQGLADELDKGSLASVGNLDLSISGVHVQVVDKFGQVVQSISPTAENAATLHVSELLLWHAQGHSIVATSDSGLDSTHMWLHNSGDLHNIQVSLPDGTGFNGWVGEYTFGEMSLTAQPPVPSPALPAADDFGPQYDDPTPSVDDQQGGTHAAVVVELNHPVNSADNTHHAATAPAQGDALNDAELDVHSAGTTGGAADSYSPVSDYLQFAGSTMYSAAMGEHSGTSNTAVHEYLAAAGIDSLTPTADDMHMPPTAVLMDLQHTGVSGEHAAANEQSVDPMTDDLAAFDNPLADDTNQHHGGI